MAKKKAVTTETSVTELPAWAQEYYGKVLGRGLSGLEQPYQAYQGPRIAQFAGEETQAFDLAKAGIGGFQPYLSQAGDYMGQAVDRPASAQAQRYLRQGTAPNTSAEAQGYLRQGTAPGVYDQAQGYLSQATAPGMGGLSSAQKYFDTATNERAMSSVSPYLGAGVSDQNVSSSMPYFQKAGSMSAIGSANPYLAAGTSSQAMRLASPYLQSAASGSALGAANPYLQAGVGSFPSQAGAYMNPYNEAVTNRIGELAGRNLRENILPGVNRTFIGGGTFGGSRSAEFTARAIRDAQEAALSEQSRALQAGYGQAADIYGADAARQIQAAQQAGQLSESDLQRQLATGKTYADIASQLASQQLQAGQTAGSLTSADAQNQLAVGKGISDIYSDVASRNLQAGQTAGTVALGDLGRIADVGQSAGALGAADADRMIRAAQASGELATADSERMIRAAQASGQLSAADADRMLRAAEVSGQLSGADADRLMRASAATSALGSEARKQAADDFSTLSQVGGSKRAMEDKSLDLAYSDFKEERDYEANKVKEAAGLIGSLNIPTSTTTTTSSPKPSTLAQLGGIGTTLLGTAIGAGAFNKPASTAAPAATTVAPTTKVKRGGAIRSKRPQKKGLGWLKEMAR